MVRVFGVWQSFDHNIFGYDQSVIQFLTHFSFCVKRWKLRNQTMLWTANKAIVLRKMRLATFVAHWCLFLENQFENFKCSFHTAFLWEWFIHHTSYINTGKILKNKNNFFKKMWTKKNYEKADTVIKKLRLLFLTCTNKCSETLLHHAVVSC